MTHTTILEGIGEELSHPLAQFPHETIRLVSLPSDYTNSDPHHQEKPKPRKSLSLLENTLLLREAPKILQGTSRLQLSVRTKQAHEN